MKNLLLMAALLPFFVSSALAAPMKPEDVPAPLKPWIGWALRGHETELCPSTGNGADKNICGWPSALNLAIENSGGHFSQGWNVYADSVKTLLPGDEKHWPQSVTVDGKPAAVLSFGGQPGLLLPKGKHIVAGSFRWKAAPEILPVPLKTGLLSLTLNGKAVPFPERDEQGKLWLNKSAAAKTAEDKTEISVRRLLRDGIPLMLSTRIRMQVSGQNREIVLGRALPENFVPLNMASALPARVEQDGRIRVQARPGTWDITLTARQTGKAQSITLNEPAGPWGSPEIWVFEGDSGFRSASVEGVPPLDSSQAEMPDEWRTLPAYLLAPGNTLKLAQRKRGDEGSASDEFRLDRQIILDFDGKGITVRDGIPARTGKAGRIEASPDLKPGMVELDNRPQFLTALKKGGAPGLELSAGDFRLDAESRMENTPRSFSAVGWNKDFSSVIMDIKLPPGWRLLHAQGPDRAHPSWVSQWTFMDFFLILVIVLSTLKLFGKGAAALAAVAFALAWNEPSMPNWAWLFPLGAAAVLRALTASGTAGPKTIRRASILYRLMSALLLVLLLPCIWGQLLNFYPQFDNIYGTYAAYSATRNRGSSFALQAGPPDRPSELLEATRGISSSQAMKGYAKLGRGLISSYAASADDSYAQPKTHIAEIDPDARLATGPGMPDWNWRYISVKWNGPVDSDRKMRLWLISPAMTKLLSFVRICLLVLLGLLLSGLPVRGWFERLKTALMKPKAAALALAALLPFATTAPSAAQMPDKKIIDELRAGLLETPACGSDCAHISSMQFIVSPDTLKIKLEAGAAASGALPLPGGARQWRPSKISLDGDTTPGLLTGADGKLWLLLSPGTHQITLEGRLPDRDAVQIHLPMRPGRAGAEASGWMLDGIKEDGTTEENIQLSRTHAGAGKTKESIRQESLPPFLRVERTLKLGLSWQVKTVVTRVSPPDAPVVLDIPLLPGESVTSQGIRASSGAVHFNMPPQAASMEWESSLERLDKITLSAPDNTQWAEIWNLDASPVWHIEAAGLPAVMPQGNGPQARQWRPWPGEKLELQISRPQSVAGQTFTIDSARLTVVPGSQTMEAELTLKFRSSMGGQHTVTLPEGAQLQSLKIDDEPQALEQEGRKVVFAALPGSHSVGMIWKEKRGLSMLWRTPRIDLGAPAVNARVEVSMPQGRWLLATGGPTLGPAVLFWPLLLLLFAAGIGLGRLPFLPLKAHEWLALMIGLTQASLFSMFGVIFWFLLLGLRKNHMPEGRIRFNMTQIALAVFTLMAIGFLTSALYTGLLGKPGMYVAGNASTAKSLLWYQDRTGQNFPVAWTFSVNMFIYRLAMLGWALWLAKSLLNWSRWGWSCWSEGGIWRSKPENGNDTK